MSNTPRTRTRARTRARASPNPAALKVKAIYAYTPSHSTELALSPGDEIEIFEMSDVGWTYGLCREKWQSGWFPITYTEDVEGEGEGEGEE